VPPMPGAMSSHPVGGGWRTPGGCST
jgi:hypothetical protein